MIGETISHYRITAKLGAGGMGIVYKAQDLQLERNVALKFLPHDLALSDSDRERFLREARSASALDHPNIGVIHGIDKAADGQIFIVMAYYEGQTLAQRLSAGHLALRQAMDWTCQIAAGLSAAHARNIIHRDIKPSNIIITNEGTARIVDFGLARVVATPSATLTGGTTGTLPYMSPEQILSEPVDQRCDVWALSVLLVQLVTGSHPFARENTTAMTFAILNQPPAAIDALPALLQPIALRGLAKDQAHRYPTAKDMLTDLESARGQFTSSGIALDEPTLTQGPQSEAMKAALKEIATHASTPRWQASSAAAQAAATAAAGASSKRKVARYLFASLALVVLAAGSLLFPSVRQRASAVLSGTAGAKHVAVLPFDNIGNDPANEAVAEGLMDSLTSKLSNLDSSQQSLWVVPSSVVRSRKVTDPSAAGKDLGANLVVKGSISRDAKNVQLTVNLIDTKDLRQVGSAQFDSANGDLASLQDEAIARLGRMMKISVTVEMLRATGGRASPAAYELYLKALGLMQRYDKPGNLDQAVSALQDAVKTDSQFALGYASLGEAYRLKNALNPDPRAVEQATAYLQRSLELDNRLPGAYVSLGKLHSAVQKFDLAQEEFQRAIKIRPFDADAIQGIASNYERSGHAADAEAEYRRAVAVQPDNWDSVNTLGRFYLRNNRFPDAIAQFKRAIELTPDNATAYSNLAGAYINQGDTSAFAEAERDLKKSIELAPSYAAYANLGNLYMEQKRFIEAAAMTQKALQLNDRDYLVWDNLRIAYQWLGDETNGQPTRKKTISLMEAYLREHAQDASAQALMAKLYALDHQGSRAQARIESALALAPTDLGVQEDVAETYAALGDRKQAIVYIRKALSNGGKIGDFKDRPGMNDITADPSFRESGK
jgi:eukaryotic-like serine/threonine-protein kinase